MVALSGDENMMKKFMICLAVLSQDSIMTDEHCDNIKLN